MPFGFHNRRKRQRAFSAQRCVRRHLSGFVFPAFDQRGVAYDLDLSLVFGEAHLSAETLLVQAAQLRLVSVMIRRAQKRSAQPAPRHIGEISLYRIAFDNVNVVEVALSESERVLIEKLPVDRHDTISKLINRRFRARCETNFITPRLFQEQPREGKERIRNRSGLDLRDDIFEYALARQKPDSYLTYARRSVSIPVGRPPIFDLIETAAPIPSALWHSATVATL